MTNDGPGAATGVTVTDTLPAGSTFVSGTPIGACTDQGGVIECILGNVASGNVAVATIEITAPDSAGQITNSVTVAANEQDLNPANDTGTEDTLVEEAQEPPPPPAVVPALLDSSQWLLIVTMAIALVLFVALRRVDGTRTEGN